MNGTTVNSTTLNTTVFVASVVLMVGCSQQQTTLAEVSDRVYFDIAMQQPMTLPVQMEIPAKHPQTGKKTIVPALYCPQCGRWYASPPAEVLQRSAAAYRCPKGGHPMSPNGTRPPA